MAVKGKKRKVPQIFEVEVAGGEGDALDMAEQGDAAVAVDPAVANGGGEKKKRKKSEVKKLKPVTEVDDAPAAGGEGDVATEEEEEEEGEDAPAAVDNGENRKKSKKTKFEIEMLGGGVAEVSGIMSNTAFDTLPVSEPTKNALRDTGFTHMTEVCALVRRHSRFQFYIDGLV
jgi:hypothetical protein